MVVFDLGGVLVRICRSWQEACAAAGEPYFELVRSEEQMAKRKALTKLHEAGQVRCEAFFEQLAETTAGLYSVAQVRRVHEAWLLALYPGVAELIEEIHRSGLATGVLSNTNRAHWDVLVGQTAAAQNRSHYAALGLVQTPHASHLLGCGKPDVAIFKAFEVATGRVGYGEQTLFFDDLPENVAGAVSAGWQSTHIDHAGDTSAQMRADLRKRGWLAN